MSVQWLEDALRQCSLDEEHEDHLLSRGVARHDLEREGVVTFQPPVEPCPHMLWTSKYGSHLDFFEGKVIFPMRTPLGELIGFEWRDGNLKKKFFVSENETRPVFLGMPFEMKMLWKLRKVALVEGAISRYVLKRVLPLPVLGTATANVSEPQLSFLERFADTVFCFFDMDKAGDLGFFSLRKKMRRNDLHLERVRFGVTGEDPADIWDRGGMPLLEKTFGGLQW